MFAMAEKKVSKKISQRKPRAKKVVETFVQDIVEESTEDFAIIVDHNSSNAIQQAVDFVMQVKQRAIEKKT
jgi:hypothetical protein